MVSELQLAVRAPCPCIRSAGRSRKQISANCQQTSMYVKCTSKSESDQMFLSGATQKCLSQLFRKQTSLSLNLRRMASLETVITELTTFAPLSLAEKWDNVGLLVEPSVAQDIQKILLTNDLTERVMKEALDEQVNMIIAYHPPIFESLKRITQGNWKQRIICQCLENRIALYSPHTSWDAVMGGVNDWVFDILNVSREESRAITCRDPTNLDVGSGRYYKLSGPAPLDLLIRNLKKNALLDCVQLALVDESVPLDQTMITKIALCAGSGSSVLKEIQDADLYLTGEMSHHEILDAVHRGTNVILTNHSNSERGFLCRFKEIMALKLPDVEFIISNTDSDPLKSCGAGSP